MTPSAAVLLLAETNGGMLIQVQEVLRQLKLGNGLIDSLIKFHHFKVVYMIITPYSFHLLVPMSYDSNTN